MFQDLILDAMVVLPRMSRRSAQTLSERLVEQCEKEGSIPPFIERPRRRLARAIREFSVQETPSDPNEPSVDKEARALDDAWRLFSSWLGAFAGLPEEYAPDVGRIRALNRMLFRSGRPLILIPSREEWAQSEFQLSALAGGGFEPIIARLGGGPFLDRVKDAHASYGKALGIRVPVKMENDDEAWDLLQSLLSAMKSYIAKVAAYADPDDSGSEILSQTLLSPLFEFRETPSASPNADNVVRGAAAS